MEAAMKVKAITVKDLPVSEQGYDRLVQSSKAVGNDFEIEKYDAVTPDQTDHLMEKYDFEWTWPWSGSKTHDKINVHMRSYGTANPQRRIACGLSHFLLWEECMNTNEPILILEHDAEFTQKFDPTGALESEYLAIGINDPHNATRLIPVFHGKVQETPADEHGCIPCPIIDRPEVAQGLAGNSAYIIKPEGARIMWDKLYELGLWPNDAILARPVVEWLGVTKEYYTRVQGLTSTTSSIH
jgi:hypothetical protein